MPQMRSRREQVEAHRFITSRMNQALVLANPDSIERPLRRIGVSIFVSVMVMALIFGGFAIATLFGKGNYPPELHHIIFEKGTNAIYVYTTPDGSDDESKAKLWPVANYTSALLLLKPYEGTKVPTQTLKPTSLDDIPRGYQVGIAGAPPSPPPPDSLLDDQDWNVCSMPIEPGSKASHYLTQLVVQDLDGAESLGADRWLLAETAVADGETPELYLLWNDHKFEIDVSGGTQVPDKLGLFVNDAVPVNQEVLDTIPTGAPLRANTQTYFGDPSGVTHEGSPLVYGQTIATGGKFFVLLRQEDGTDQFAEVSATEQALLDVATGLEALEVPSQVMTGTGAQAAYGPSEFPFPQEILSEDVWTEETDSSAVCATYDPTAAKSDEKITIELFRSAPSVLTDAAKSVDMDGEGNYISNVVNQKAQTVLPSGTASLVDAQANPGQTIEGITYLVDSLGYRFGLVDEGTTDQTQNLLGYAGVEPIGVPDVMLSLIPQGADLDPHAARSQLDPQGEDLPVYDTGESPSESASAEGGS